jgi:TrmH family RNA methyltransferase
MITSSSNDKVKCVRKLQSQRSTRRAERCFVVEGVRLVEEAVRASLIPAFVLYTEQLASEGRGKALLVTLRGLGASCHVVTESVMRSCSDTTTPQGVLAVLSIPHIAPPEPHTFVLIVDGLRDPGNLGTLLRTARAAGVEQVLLAPDTVDFTNPKVLRSAMGAHFWLPIREASWETVAEMVSDCDVWLAAAGGGRAYTEVDWTRPAALILGSEAHGAGEEARSLAQGSVSIPIQPSVESLNAAVAAAIILFEVVRHRGSHTAEPSGC